MHSGPGRSSLSCRQHRKRVQRRLNNNTPEFHVFLQSFAHFWALSVPIGTSARWRSALEYKQFIIHAFEREFGKWRARIWRLNGAPIAMTGRTKLRRFVTGLDAKTAPAAILMAMAAIDAGTFSAHRVHSEKFWRCQDRASAEPSRQMRQVGKRRTTRRATNG
jgi:hypothetical protein